MSGPRNVQIGIAAHSEESTNLLWAVPTLVNSLKRWCIDPVIIVGGYWGLMKHVVDEALAKGLRVMVTVPIEREDVRLPGGVIRVNTGCEFRCRSIILVRSSDALIVLGGGIGTIIEAMLAYAMAKPTFILVGTGLSSDNLSRAFPEYFDERRVVKVVYLSDPGQLAKEACEAAMGATATKHVEFG